MLGVNSITKIMLVSCTLVVLSGCVVAIGDKNSSSGDAAWRQAQQTNLQRISRLTPGATTEEIRQQLGTPDFTELFQKQGQEVQVLFYRTHLRHSDGKTTKDECTPLIFVDNKLTGWGDKAYQYM